MDTTYNNRINIDALFKASRQSNKKELDRPVNAGLVVAFSSTDFIQSIEDRLSEDLPTLKRYGNYLIGISSDRNALKHAEKVLSTVIYSFEQELLAEPLKAGWLEEYNALERMGIRSYGVCDNLNSEKDIPSYLCGRNEGLSNSEDHRKMLDTAIEQYSAYSGDHLLKSLCAFSDKYFTGFRDLEHTRETFTKVLDLCAELADHTSTFIPSSKAIPHFRPLFKKTLATHKGSDIELLTIVTRQSEVEDTISRLGTLDRGIIERNIPERLLALFTSECPDFEYPLAKKGSDTEQPEADILFRDNSFTSGFSMPDSLSARSFAYVTTEYHENDQAQSLCHAILKHYTEILFFKHMGNLQKAIVDLSDSMDIANPMDEAIRVIIESRPRLKPSYSAQDL
jgi:hypothetical protein